MFRNFLLSTITASIAVLALSGCDFYFEEEEDFYTYCDSSGCFACDSFGCWDTGDGRGETGWACKYDSNCEVGCFCNEAGLCEEGGTCFISEDECSDGFYCDDRDSCVPAEKEECVPGSCNPGTICDESVGECIPGCDATHPCGPGFTCDEAMNQCVLLECEDLESLQLCLSRNDTCIPIYNGVNCENTEGGECVGNQVCICESYPYSHCETK